MIRRASNLSNTAKSIVCLINSRSGSAHDYIETLENICEESGIRLKKLTVLNNPANLQPELKKLLKLKPNIVMIGGGDGTIITSIDYLMKQGYQERFAILPLGTANYLARNLHIPLDIPQAVQLAAGTHVTNLRLPLVNDSLFSLIANIGITTEVSENVSVRLKKQLGQTAYVVELLRQLFGHESFTYDITLENDKRLRGESHQIVVSNADLSVQLALTPDSDLHDPTVTLTIYDSGKNKLKLVAVLFLYMFSFGKIKRGMKVYKVTRAKIDTKPVKSISVDGEILQKTPIEISFTKEVIRILTPVPAK